MEIYNAWSKDGGEHDAELSGGRIFLPNLLLIAIVNTPPIPVRFGSVITILHETIWNS